MLQALIQTLTLHCNMILCSKENVSAVFVQEDIDFDIMGVPFFLYLKGEAASPVVTAQPHLPSNTTRSPNHSNQNKTGEDATVLFTGWFSVVPRCVVWHRYSCLEISPTFQFNTHACGILSSLKVKQN